VKLKGTCARCDREFLVQQVLESQGHCPWCGQPFQPHYTAVLADALLLAEDAGNTLENALEKIAGMKPALVLDESSLLEDVQAHLEEIRRGKKPRYP
jgi:DNA repair exonuclease SbcCD ATPase subunit